MTPLEQYDYKFGCDSRSMIIGWMQAGPIDMLSHDDIPYLQGLIEEAGLRWVRKIRTPWIPNLNALNFVVHSACYWN